MGEEPEKISPLNLYKITVICQHVSDNHGDFSQKTLFFLEQMRYNKHRSYRKELNPNEVHIHGEKNGGV